MSFEGVNELAGVRRFPSWHRRGGATASRLERRGGRSSSKTNSLFELDLPPRLRLRRIHPSCARRGVFRACQLIHTCIDRAAVFAFLFFLCFSINAFADYRTVELESLRITIDSDWAPLGAPGYLPVRFDIVNLAEAREIVITASGRNWFDPYRRGRSSSTGFTTGTAEIRQTVRLKRGDRVKLTLPLPVFADSESFQFFILENGKPLQGFSSHLSFQSGRPIAETAVLFVANRTSPLGAEAAGWARPVTFSRPFYAAPVPTSGAAAPPMDFLLDPDRLPTNWLGFTTLRAVLIGPAEWSQLTPPQQEALLTWTASGGDLLLVDGPLDTILPPARGSTGWGGKDSVRSYFFGHIHALKSADIRDKGFVNTISSLDDPSLIPDWALPANRAKDWGWIAERGFRSAIEGAGEIPSRSYLSILVLFVALIGPVNYIYLWRKKQQVLMVATVPLISFCFILLLTGYGLLLQGFDVQVRAITFTVLDQDLKHAATRSSVSLYPGGITPSSGLRFASDAAIFPLGADGLGPRGAIGLDLTGEQQFHAGLLQARSPSNFEQVGFRPARERLSFERAGDGISVVNGLGSTVRQLFYRYGGKTYALGDRLPAGNRAPLKIAGFRPVDLYTEPLKNSALTPLKFQEVILSQSDGAYLAVLETSPFWDPGVATPVERQSFHLVLGYTEGLP